VPAAPRRPFGRSGFELSPFCLDGNVFGWSAGEEASFAVLDAYVAAGGDVIDSANVYSAWVPGNEGGESEAIIGRWLAGRADRDDLVVATKVGWAGGAHPKGLARDQVLRGAEGSGASWRAVDEVAEAHGASEAQVALAWVMARRGITCATASATSAEQVRELAGAMDLVLGDEDVMRLDAASTERV
jgi:aryl-alcohol dehydrogenase-like predicted oxidoreductase